MNKDLKIKHGFTLAEVFSVHPKGGRKQAFTLAEVLITLGIIGVVAAMTLPVLIQKHQEKETIVKVKKITSTIQQAFVSAMSENGSPSEWAYAPDGDEHQFDFIDNIKPFLKISKDCGTNAGCINTGLCYKTYNNTGTHNGDHCSNYNRSSSYYKMILNDGSVLWFRTNNTSLMNLIDVFFDMNGKLPPNTVGRDVFSFYIDKRTGFPIRYTNIETRCLTTPGFLCYYWIMEKGNMDYLREYKKLKGN